MCGVYVWYVCMVCVYVWCMVSMVCVHVCVVFVWYRCGVWYVCVCSKRRAGERREVRSRTQLQ